MNEKTRLRVLIAGGTGFVGQNLIKSWKLQHHITVLGRNTKKLKQQFPTLDALNWDMLNNVNPNDFDVVINLSGETINHLRWTDNIKAKILQSRIQTTEALVNWATKTIIPNLHFLNTSALSIYGLYQKTPEKNNNEQTLITRHQEFLCNIANTWEQTLQPLLKAKIAVTSMRFAVVFGKHGGAFPKLYLAAKLGMGAKLGNGQQPFAWISLDDLVSAIDWLVHKRIVGPVNMVAPHILTQDQLTEIMSNNLHRPYFLRFPAKILKLVLGQMADELLLKGQTALPEVLTNSGFKFKYNSFQDFIIRVFA